MENASKALIMGAGILLAILLIGVAINFFRSASQVTKTYDMVMRSEEIMEFNGQFTKYLTDGQNSRGDKKEAATIYDVISCANYAYNFNNRVVEDPQNATRSQDPVILEIAIEKSDGTVVIDNLQKHSNIYTELIQRCYYANNASPNVNNIIRFKATRVENNEAGRVNYVTFRSQVYIDNILEDIKKHI